MRVRSAKERGSVNRLEQAARRRAEILQAALRLFGRRDYAEVSTREIADEAGVSLRLMFYHFGTKDKLRDAVDAHALDLLGAITDSARSLAAQDRLAAVIDGAARVARQPALIPYVRRMLMDDGERGSRLFQGVVDRFLTLFEVPGNPRAYTAEQRQHEVGVLSALLGAILLKPHLDRRYGRDVHGRSEREARLAMHKPVLEAVLRTTWSKESATPSSRRSRSGTPARDGLGRDRTAGRGRSIRN